MMDFLREYSAIIAIICLLPILLAVVWLFFLQRYLFGSGIPLPSGGDTIPTPEEVGQSLRTMDDEAIALLRQLRVQYQTSMPDDHFARLCMATALSIEEPPIRLSQPLVLADFLSSLDRAEYILLLETLFELEIPDEIAGNLGTFEEVIRHVESESVRLV